MSEPFSGRPQVFRDPIHGHVAFAGELGKTVKRLVDTPEFQRLRHIRQNGITNLVFHGAEHSRFAHSLGVAFTATRMLAAIQRNSDLTLTEEEHDDTVLAALLHDVGHGPFSHTLEEILRELAVDFDHEAMTVRFMREGNIASILEDSSVGRSVRLVEFIEKKKDDTRVRWWHSIVSSQLDADRLDYVQRDACMAGISNHRPDIPRLIEYLGVSDGRVIVDIVRSM
ncbi:MAG: HD domain-containing protein [Deltaproteobacteria bacterium]|nr:HD domain-containing protein [Deltaproteobacteria bacterium]